MPSGRSHHGLHCVTAHVPTRKDVHINYGMSRSCPQRDMQAQQLEGGTVFVWEVKDTSIAAYCTIIASGIWKDACTVSLEPLRVKALGIGYLI